MKHYIFIASLALSSVALAHGDIHTTEDGVTYVTTSDGLIYVCNHRKNVLLGPKGDCKIIK